MNERDRDRTVEQVLSEFGSFDREEVRRLAAEASGEGVPLEQYLVRTGRLGADGMARLVAEVEWRHADTPLRQRYRIDGLLGRGGMAAVYRAHDQEIDRPVALKVLRGGPGFESDPKRFVREARAVGRLDHPNIVTIFDAGIDGDCQYLVVQLVEGKTFERILAENGTSHRDEHLMILERVARAVHYAHEKGILHRDLKPANVLVNTEGRPLVSDFGLARMDDNAGQTCLTREGSAMGTPAYMAPEQVLGQIDSLSPSTDVYALGAMLYEILTGQRPHPGNTTIEIYLHVIEKDPIPPAQIDPTIPPALSRLALESMARDPKDRVPSAAAFADRLAQALGLAPAGERRPGTASVPRPTATGLPRAAGPSRVPAPGGATTGTATRPVQGPVPTSATPTPPTRRATGIRPAPAAQAQGATTRQPTRVAPAPPPAPGLDLMPLDEEPDTLPPETGSGVFQAAPPAVAAGTPRWVWGAAGGAAFLVVVAVVVVLAGGGSSNPDPVDPVPAADADPGKDLFATAEGLRAQHGEDPTFHEQLVRAYETILKKHPGTPSADRAQITLSALKLQREKWQDDHLARIRPEAEKAARFLDLVGALTVLEQAGAAFSDPGWERKLAGERVALLQLARRSLVEAVGRLDTDLDSLGPAKARAEIERLRRSVPDELSSTLSDVLGRLGPLESRLAGLEADRAQAIRRWAGEVRRSLPAAMPAALRQAGKEADDYLAEVQGEDREAIRQLRREIDDRLPAARREALAAGFEALASGRAKEGSELVLDAHESSTREAARQALGGFLGRIRDARRDAWRAQAERGAEAAIAEWKRHEEERPERTLAPAGIEAAYPYAVEREPFQRLAEIAGLADRLLGELARTRAVTVKFRLAADDERRSYVVKTEGGRFLYRYGGGEFEGLEPLEDLAVEDVAAIAAGDRLDSTVPSRTGSVSDRVLLHLARGEADLARALERQLPTGEVDRFRGWIEAVTGAEPPVGPDPGRDDPPGPGPQTTGSELETLRRLFGQGTTGKVVGPDRVEVEIVVDCRNRQHVETYFDAASGSARVASDGLHLQGAGGGSAPGPGPGPSGPGGSNYLLKGIWIGDLEVEVRFRFGEDRGVFGIVYAKDGERDLAAGLLPTTMGQPPEIVIQDRDGPNWNTLERRSFGRPTRGKSYDLVLVVGTGGHRLEVKQAGSVSARSDRSQGAVGFTWGREEIVVERVSIKGTIDTSASR